MTDWSWVLPLAIGVVVFGYVMNAIEKKLNRIIQLLHEIKVGRRDL